MRPHHSATLPRTGNLKRHVGTSSSPVSVAGELETVHVSSSPYGPVEGVWAHIPPPPAPDFSPQQTSPPPVEVQSPVITPTAMTQQVAIQALQQVMSAGGQQVKVSGQQLEVVEKSVTSSSSTTPQEQQGSEEESVAEGEITQHVTPPTSQPPTTSIPPVTGNGDVAAVSPMPGAVYAMSYSYPGANMMPIYPPVAPPPQPAERTTDSPVTNTSPVQEGEAPDGEAIKYNQNVMSYMFPVVYGYGMGYGQPWMFPVPMMPSPTTEDGKPVAVSPGENCQVNQLSHDLQNVQLSGNQQEMVSSQASVMMQPPPPEVHPPPPPPPSNSVLVHPPHTEAPPGPPATHHHNPPLLPNPSHSPHHHHHPPLSMAHLPPPFPNPAMPHPPAVSCSVPHLRHLHQSPLGHGKSLDQRDGYRRGRGGFNHQGGRGGYNNNYHGPPNNNHHHHHHYGGPGRGGGGGPGGGGQRSLPPRMQRGNGGSGGQRSAYEGQPLMLMSSTESLNSQTNSMSGGSVVSSPAVMYPMGELDGRGGPRPPSGTGGQLVGESVEGGGNSEVFYSPDGTPMMPSPAAYDANMYNGGYIPCYQAPPGYIMGPVGQWVYPPTYPYPSPTAPHHHHPPHTHHPSAHPAPMPSAAYLQ